MADIYMEVLIDKENEFIDLGYVALSCRARGMQVSGLDKERGAVYGWVKGSEAVGFAQPPCPDVFAVEYLEKINGVKEVRQRDFRYMDLDPVIPDGEREHLK